MIDYYTKDQYTIRSKPKSTLEKKFNIINENEGNLKHISSLFLPIDVKLVCGSDNREPINARTSPYKSICRLIIKVKGKTDLFLGSGFFISPKCVITSGHCVHQGFSWAESITVIPGANGPDDFKPFGTDTSSNFKSVKGWTQDKNKDFDYGAIILNDDTLFKKVDQHLNFKILSTNKTIFNSGYPNEYQNKYKQLSSSGMIKEITTHRIYYDIDTYKGNSGSPIFINEGGIYFVVGVHSYGECPNYAIRINENIRDIWNKWKSL